MTGKTADAAAVDAAARANGKTAGNLALGAVAVAAAVDSAAAAGIAIAVTDCRAGSVFAVAAAAVMSDPVRSPR